jgi:hypothetical protein
MNKAFVREPDDTGQLNCPACGSLGIQVTRETWSAHVQPSAGAQLAESAFFCPFAKCQIVYFDMFERHVTTGELLHGVYPKDSGAAICGCFGLTIEDVQADVDEGTPTRVRELLAKAKSPEARCRTCSPSGQPCTPEVQRAYMKLRGLA